LIREATLKQESIASLKSLLKQIERSTRTCLLLMMPTTKHKADVDDLAAKKLHLHFKDLLIASPGLLAAGQIPRSAADPFFSAQ
jgi:hypothetical protein